MQVLNPPPRPSSAGFTLVELLIVVVLIGIVVLFAIPKINVGRLRAKAAMQTIGTSLLEVQREAVARQHNIVVMIDTTRKSLRVLYDSNNNLVENAGERLRVIQLGEELVFGRPATVAARAFGGSAISFSTTVSGLPAIVYSRNGSAREAGGLYLTTIRALRGFPGHEGETWAMEMIRATGRPEWYRWNGTAWLRGF
jgi:prepilin-type N-terminal cleavage/methylation domain-containing protein